MTQFTTTLRAALIAVAGLKRRTFFGFALLLPIAVGADVATISIGDAAVTQPASGSTPMVFTLTRTGDTGYAVVAPYETREGTAIAGADYTATSGSVTIPAGAGSAAVTVDVPAGSNPADKNFFLNLASATGLGPTPDFAVPASFGSGHSPFAVDAADINGDGRLDLLVTNAVNNGTNVSVLINTAAPGAAAPAFAGRRNFPTGNAPDSLAVADVNGDGRPDLLTIGSSTSETNLSVLLNTTAAGASTPSFTAQRSFRVDGATGSIAAADVNGDGRVDVLIPNVSLGTVSVLLNVTAPGATTPEFADQQRFATSDRNAFAVAAADVNGDGRPDLVVTTTFPNDTVNVLLNNTVPGSATLSFAAPQSWPVGAAPYSVRAADINGDGRPDLLTANAISNTISVLINSTVPGASVSSFAPAGRRSFEAGANPHSIVASDFNGDGRLDLLTASPSGTVSLLLNTTAPGSASPAFAARLSVASIPGAIVANASDVNGDGRPDVLVTSQTLVGIPAAVSVLLNTTPAGAATPGFAAQQDFGTGRTPESLCSADMNGDGRPDLVTADYNSGSVSVLLNTAAPGAGAAAFAAKQSFSSGGDLPISVACADMNGDGRLDVLVANHMSRNVAVLLNTTAPGATVPTLGTAQPFAADFLPLSVGTVDLNGDGRPDLLATNFIANAGTVDVWINSTAPGASDASFAERQSFSTGFGAPHNLAGADINGDGRPDLLVAQQGIGLVVLLNTTAAGATAASFADFRTFATGSGVTFDVSAADINGDGRLDALLANEDTGTVSVLLNGTAPGAMVPAFASGGNFVTGNRPQSVRAADLDGDGRPDLAIVNENASTVAVLLNRTAPGATTTSFEAPRLLATGLLPSAVTAADFNGDGQPDLAVSNFSSDNVSVLLNTLYSAHLGDGTAVGTIHRRDGGDTTPDPFSFTPASGVAPGSVNTSNTITVSGITGPTPISITGGSYRLSGGGLVTTDGLVNNGDRVTVRTTASSQLNTTVTATLTIGGVRADYRVTTVNDDCTPDPFRFTRVKPAELNTVYVSNTVVIAGIPTTVECRARTSTGGMSVNGGPFTTERVQLFNGDTVRLRITSSGAANRTVHATFRMGEAIRSFDVTTGN